MKYNLLRERERAIMQALIAFNLKNTELIMCSITGAVSKESIREINDKKDFPIFFKFSILFVYFDTFRI